MVRGFVGGYAALFVLLFALTAIAMVFGEGEGAGGLVVEPLSQNLFEPLRDRKQPRSAGGFVAFAFLNEDRASLQVNVGDARAAEFAATHAGMCCQQAHGIEERVA